MIGVEVPAAAVALLALVGVFALVDWIAVAARSRALEYAAKPAVVAALVGVAASLAPVDESQRLLFVVALLFSLAGDVYLMLDEDRFLEGLVAFFLAHMAYVTGLALDVVGLVALGAAVAVVTAVALPLGLRVLGAVRRGPDPGLLGPVIAYTGALGLLLAVAIATGDAVAAGGALLFAVSDTLLGWRRFVRSRPWMPVAIMVTYHLGQTGLVVSLAVQ